MFHFNKWKEYDNIWKGWDSSFYNTEIDALLSQDRIVFTVMQLFWCKHHVTLCCCRIIVLDFRERRLFCVQFFYRLGHRHPLYQLYTVLIAVCLFSAGSRPVVSPKGQSCIQSISHGCSCNWHHSTQSSLWFEPATPQQHWIGIHAH